MSGLLLIVYTPPVPVHEKETENALRVSGDPGEGVVAGHALLEMCRAGATMYTVVATNS